MNNFLVKLFPEQPFFFGGENTFDSGDETNYFIRSNYFPQQTGLLGLLRYQLLKEHNKLNNGSGPWQPDINIAGMDSFDASELNQTFGQIQSLSPVFIRFENTGKPVKNYIPLSFDYGNSDNGPVPLEFTETEASLNGRMSLSYYNNSIPRIKNYKAKDGIAHLLIESEGIEFRNFDFNKYMSVNAPNGIFVKSERVGIMKNRNGSREEDAFYRQKFFNLRPGYCFAFYAKLTNGLKNDLVRIGKEKTLFRMEVVDAGDQHFTTIFNRKTFLLKRTKREKQVILTSDAFVNNEIYDACDFAITETVDFRNIRTPQSVENFGALKQRNEPGNYRYRSDKYNMLKRGSVLYGNPTAIENKLNNSHFNQIGYNEFLIY